MTDFFVSIKVSILNCFFLMSPSRTKVFFSPHMILSATILSPYEGIIIMMMRKVMTALDGTT